MSHGKEHDERRRAPRAPATCDAKIVSSGGRHFTARAEDVGPQGCRVVAPRPLARGAILRILLTERHGEADLLGTVAWVSEQAPWRLGIAFAPHSIAAARAWFEGLSAGARAQVAREGAAAAPAEPSPT